jgi:hypothetical protein
MLIALVTLILGSNKVENISGTDELSSNVAVVLTLDPSYCGNVINTGSVLATSTNCSFICPGN